MTKYQINDKNVVMLWDYTIFTQLFIQIIWREHIVSAGQ